MQKHGGGAVLGSHHLFRAVLNLHVRTWYSNIFKFKYEKHHEKSNNWEKWLPHFEWFYGVHRGECSWTCGIAEFIDDLGGDERCHWLKVKYSFKMSLKRLRSSKTVGVFLKSLNLATLNSACLFFPLNLKTTICCSDRGLCFTSTPVNKGTDWQGVAACAFTPCKGAVGYKLLILLFFVEHVARRQCKFAFTTVQHSARHCADIWFERIR